ncbi:hypothetical protein DPMN_097462 [Dreissena polymorpha]|uniref:Uncharacterized protein n=1 Tax=Dreissena polymorpha TaxID=45954 RepID=A0A9D4LAA9_DREPO|nr:hypothetical protein DPMN_097462 [Dreissena polymorpha]
MGSTTWLGYARLTGYTCAHGNTPEVPQCPIRTLESCQNIDDVYAGHRQCNLISDKPVNFNDWWKMFVL